MIPIVYHKEMPVYCPDCQWDGLLVDTIYRLRDVARCPNCSQAVVIVQPDHLVNESKP